MSLITDLLNFLGYVWPFLFVLTLIVFVHEMGHFLMARFFGVKVDEFSIGFGKELFGFTDKKGTRWKFAIIPLGGYVKMLGDGDPASVTKLENTTQDQEFMKKHAFPLQKLHARAMIVLAGPVANFVLTFVIFLFFSLFIGERITLPLIHEVLEGSAAEKAGFLPGDVIKKINDENVESFSDVSKIAIVSAGRELVFEVERDGVNVVLLATPRKTEIKDDFNNIVYVGRLGIVSRPQLDDFQQKDYNIVQAVGKAAKETTYLLKQTVYFLSEMIAGRQDASQIGGPVRIAQISGQVAEYGFAALLHLAALLSISIGILNLLPLPVLDGGHLVFYAIEAIRGKPVSPKVQQGFATAGVSLLLILMLLVTFNDIKTLLN